MKKKKKTLLVVGDRRKQGKTLDPSFNAFVRVMIKNSQDKNLEAYVASYKDVFSGKLPEISNNTLKVLLFFPYKYWDKNIEVYKDHSKVYGDNSFGKGFTRYFKKVDLAIRKIYKNKKIEYVNPPEISILDRDKEETKKFFRHHKIPTPMSFHPKNLKDLHRIIDRGTSLYVKPRFGAMGKGITYLSRDLMITNFLFQKGEIVSHSYDYHWRFHEIKESDRNKFLRILLTRGFVFEEAIDPPIHKGRRSDFRVYCLYGEVVYYYLRSTPAITVVTNWSQGGTIEQKRKFSKYIPASKLNMVKSLARKISRDLKMNYAGIDIIFSKDYRKIYALEAHSFAGYEKGFDLMNELFKKIANLPR